MPRLFRWRRGQGDAEAAPEQAQAEAAELEEVYAAATTATRRGVLGRLSGLFRAQVDDDFWEELEETLILGDLGAGLSMRIVGELRDATSNRDDAETVKTKLRERLVALLEAPAPAGRLWDGRAGEQADEPEAPLVIFVVGVNGAGKTTSIAKLARAYQDEGRTVLLAAGDTFRAAAIEQLQEWGSRLDAAVIAHQPGSDPGAVVYDALEAAKSRGAGVVIVDTAGRLQTQANLMAELGKVRRVIETRHPGAPHEVLLVLDATSGQNGLAQARAFAQATGVTAICLAKLDGTSKGGIVFAVADELGIPVRFAGTGERAEDLAPFDPAAFVDALLA